MSDADQSPELGATGWRVCRRAGLRGAGFPADLALALAAPGLALAADALLAAEDALAQAAQAALAALAALLAAQDAYVPALRRLQERLAAGQSIPAGADEPPPLRAPLASYRAALGALEAARRQLVGSAEQAAPAWRGRLRELAVGSAAGTHQSGGARERAGPGPLHPALLPQK